MQNLKYVIRIESKRKEDVNSLIQRAQDTNKAIGLTTDLCVDTKAVTFDGREESTVYEGRLLWESEDSSKSFVLWHTLLVLADDNVAISIEVYNDVVV